MSILDIITSRPKTPVRDIPTNNPGTGSKPEDETITLLRSIDKRMAAIQFYAKEILEELRQDRM